MTEIPVFTTETSPEVITTETARQFATQEEAFEHGYTNHVGLSNKLDSRVGQNPTELQLLQAQHQDIAVVRNVEAPSYFDVFAMQVEQDDVASPSLARRIARAVFNRH